MAMRTYEVKFNGKTISVKAKKDTAKSFSWKLGSLLSIESYRLELAGIRGVKHGVDQETSYVMMTIGGSEPLPDPDGYQADLAKFTAEIPETLVDDKTGALGLWYAKANELFSKHVPVEDKRKTQEEAEADAEELRQIDRERESKREIAAKEDAQAAEIIRSQYPYLTTIKASGKSGHAGGAANLKAELAKAFPGVVFSVKSDSYSMGEAIRVSWTDGPTGDQVREITGKYQTGGFDAMQDLSYSTRTAFNDVFGGAKHVSTSRKESPELVIMAAKKELNIDLTADDLDQWGGIKRESTNAEMAHHIREAVAKTAFYPDGTPEAAPGTPTAAPGSFTNGSVTVRRNWDLNGVEILFTDGNPGIEVTTRVKYQGFRWNHHEKLWWAKYTDSKWAYALSLVGKEMVGTDALTEQQDRQSMEFCPSEREAR